MKRSFLIMRFLSIFSLIKEELNRFDAASSFLDQVRHYPNPIDLRNDILDYTWLSDREL